MRYLIFALLFVSSCSVADVSLISQDEMEKNVANHTEIIKQQKGDVSFIYKGVKMLLISDVKHDCMRIIAPVKRYAELTTMQKTPPWNLIS